MANNSWITSTGETLIANALASNTPFNIDTWKVGDTENVAFDQSLIDVVGSVVDSGTVAEIEFDIISTDHIIIRVILDESKGPYLVGNVGLFNGTDLIAIGTFENAREKTPNAIGVVGNRLVINVPIQFVDVQSAIDFTVISGTFASWPFVQELTDLPDPNIAPFEGYIVREDPSQNRPITAIRNEEPAGSGTFVWALDYHNKIAGDSASNTDCISIDTITGLQEFTVAGSRVFSLDGTRLASDNDGSASNPSYSWQTSLNTGLFLEGTDSVAITAQGNERFRVNTSSALITAGSATNPGLGVIGDTDTGIYSSGANLLDFTTNGVRRLTIDNDGQILAAADGSSAVPSWSFFNNQNTGLYSVNATTLGITAGGTFIANLSENSGAAQIQANVVGTSASLPSFTWSNDTDTGMLRPSTNVLGFTTGGVERLTLNGSLGSATITENTLTGASASSFADTLVLQNNDDCGLSILADNDDFSVIYFGDQDSNSVGGILYGHTANELSLRAGGSSSFKVTGNQQLLSNNNGSAATPVFGFNNDLDSGLYLVSTGVLGVSTGGALRLSIGAGGLRTGTLGLETFPAYSFEGDTNTGVWSAGADILSFSTGGVERARFTTSALELTNGTVFEFPDGAAGAPSVTFSSNPLTGLYYKAPGVCVTVNAIERMEIGTNVVIRSNVTDFSSEATTNQLNNGVRLGSAGETVISKSDNISQMYAGRVSDGGGSIDLPSGWSSSFFAAGSASGLTTVFRITHNLGTTNYTFTGNSESNFFFDGNVTMVHRDANFLEYCVAVDGGNRVQAIVGFMITVN